MEGRELDLEAILAGAHDPTPEGHRSGLVGLVGRPNVGKSTLLNAMLGTKVAIVTQVPGTTRNAIRGVLTRDAAQVVFLDTPGLTKPRTLLARRLNELVRQTWAGVDVLCMLVDVADGIGKGDRYLAGELAGSGRPIIAVANKEDLVEDKDRLIPELDQLSRLADVLAVVPVSARTGFNVEHLIDVIIAALPEGPRLFAGGDVTDQPERQLAAEMIREKLVSRMSDEVPHSIAVMVDDVRDATHRDDLVEVDATILVERDSQKGIVIGKRGQLLKEASTEARHDLETLFGRKVFLTTHVKVWKDWQRDPKKLRRLGY